MPVTDEQLSEILSKYEELVLAAIEKDSSVNDPNNPLIDSRLLNQLTQIRDIKAAIANAGGAASEIVEVSNLGNLLTEGTAATGVTGPTGGSGAFKWLSGIWQLVSSLSTVLTGGTQKAIARGGAKGSTAAADITSTSIDANIQALDVIVRGTPQVSISNTTIGVTAPDLSSSGTVSTVDSGSTSAIQINGQSVVTGVATTNSAVAIGAVGYAAVSFLITGSWSGNLQFELSTNGSTWIPVSAIIAGINGRVTQTNSPGFFIIPSGGATNFRVRALSWNSGSAIVAIRASQRSGIIDNTSFLSEGNAASGVTGPSGGSGAFKWLSGIWQLISDRLPSLVANSVPIVLKNSIGSEIGIEAEPVFSKNLVFQSSGYDTNPSNYIAGESQLLVDDSGRLITSGAASTQEGSRRLDFSGNSLFNTISGTVVFTNGTQTITGTNTAFTSELKVGQYLKKTADANNLAVQISEIISDTEIILASFYAGTSASTSADTSEWFVNEGNGSISVANSLVTLSSGTANNNNTYIFKQGDYQPCSLLFKTSSVSQRIANQTIIVGLVDNYPNISQGAWIEFTGTNSNTITFKTRSSADTSDIQSTTVTLSNSILNTANNNYFQIDITNGQATLSLGANSQKMSIQAIHRDHLPDTFQILKMTAAIANSAIVTNTNLSLDFVVFYNTNQVEITSGFVGEPIKTDDLWRYAFYTVTTTGTGTLVNGIVNSAALPCPPNKEWQILGAHVTYVSNAFPGNRVVALRIENPAGVPIGTLGINPTTQAANLTRRYSFNKNGVDYTTFRLTTELLFNIGDVHIGEGAVVRAYDGAAILSSDTVTLALRVREKTAI